MIWGLRGTFAVLLAFLGARLATAWWHQSYPNDTPQWWWGSLAGLLFASIFIVIEVHFTRRFVALISTVLFGVIFGFIASYLFTTTLFLLPAVNEAEPWFREWVQYACMAVFIYLAVVGILQSKDDFKFVIPFVELKKEETGPKPLILDTSVIIDGRIADVMDMKLIATRVILPRFVLTELQQVADSQDKLKRNRGRRGLDVLNRIQNAKGTAIEIYEGTPPAAEGVDGKLVALAKFLDARVVTNDFNLNKIAQLQGVDVVNLNDLALAMRPVILPGEMLEVRIQKPGEGHGQGVGYLDDGTMVVVEGGYNRLGETVPISVTSVIQTSAGRMIFGQLKGQSQVPSVGASPSPPPAVDQRGGRRRDGGRRPSDAAAPHPPVSPPPQPRPGPAGGGPKGSDAPSTDAAAKGDAELKR
ncbi:MAG: TRAM domain-containing protein [Planctomycetia bacterium]|nr:TRAM domain-containing protein [Planctomycetia bacterium]